MIETILKLKDNNKILFWILIPLVIIALVVKFLMDMNIAGAKKDLLKTKKVDIDLAAEQEAANNKANALLQEALNAGDKAKNHENKAKNSESDLDWHLKD